MPNGRRQRAKSPASSTLLTSLTLISPPKLLFTASTSPSSLAAPPAKAGVSTGGLGTKRRRGARGFIASAGLLEGGDAVAQRAGLGLRWRRGIRHGDVCTSRSIFPRCLLALLVGAVTGDGRKGRKATKARKQFCPRSIPRNFGSVFPCRIATPRLCAASATHIGEICVRRPPACAYLILFNFRFKSSSNESTC
jgi:hypothetical protein